MPINEYLKQVSRLYSAGNATEHNYRPAKIIVALTETDRIMKEIDHENP